MSVAEAFFALRNALALLRKCRTVRNRARLFAAAQRALKLLKDADAGLVHGDLESLSAELATALRTLRRGFLRESAKRHGSGLETGRTSRAKHLSIKGAGHGVKRGTQTRKGKTQPEAQAEKAAMAA